jgi:hypothetical protein
VVKFKLHSAVEVEYSKQHKGEAIKVVPNGERLVFCEQWSSSFVLESLCLFFKAPERCGILNDSMAW